MHPWYLRLAQSTAWRPAGPTPTLRPSASRTLPLATPRVRTPRNANNATKERQRPYGVHGRQRARADADRDRSRGDAPPARQYREAARRPGGASVLSSLQAGRSPLPARRGDEVPRSEPPNLV